MRTHTTVASQPLHVGDRVRVKSADAILATLDGQGEVDSMPFMPEMLGLCGQSFVVSKRADKTCDTVQTGALRRMTDTVHLAELRCDGSAHGGCQTGCRFFWKEDWLVRDPSDEPVTAASVPAPAVVGPSRAGATIATLQRATTVDSNDGVTHYSCQATHVRAATSSLSPFDVRQYMRDVTSGNEPLRKVIPQLAISLFNKYQDVSRHRLPPRLRIRGGMRYPFIAGALDKTPSQRVGLQPGDVVQIKSRDEIVATLDTHNRNRGMSFDVEMLKYCGKYARVLRRVQRIIDEKTGVMLNLRNECIVLDNVVCDADFHRFCPRGMYPFWREIWLRKVDE